MDETTIRPLRRDEDLLVERLQSGEVVVIDLRSNRAHTLSPAAAAVWDACDGTRTLPELAAALPEALRVEGPLQEVQIRQALTRLHAKRLLSEPKKLPPGLRCTRRQLTGVALALIPVVASIVTPTAAEAASPLGHGQPCFEGIQCASGVCAGGQCWGS